MKFPFKSVRDSFSEWRASEEGERTSKNVRTTVAVRSETAAEFFNFSHRTCRECGQLFSTKRGGNKNKKQKKRRRTDRKKENKGVERKKVERARVTRERWTKGGKARASLVLILPGVNRGWFELLITCYLRNGLQKEGRRKRKRRRKRRRELRKKERKKEDEGNKMARVKRASASLGTACVRGTETRATTRNCFLTRTEIFRASFSGPSGNASFERPFFFFFLFN